jgi:hypothetical protein
MKPYGPHVYDRIAELWAQNLTTADIGAALGVPKNSVCRMAFTARGRGDERFPMRDTGFRPKGSKMPQPTKHHAFPTLRAPRPKGLPRIYELLERECRYPVEFVNGHRFCAEATVGETSYCERHLALCNAPSRRVLERA